MKKIFVTDFSEFPGPRYEALGPHSGEKFRQEVLLPAISEFKGDITIILDGAFGYGSSFLDESFGGLIREGIDHAIVLKICENLISEEDPSLKAEITSWVNDAIKLREKPTR